MPQDQPPPLQEKTKVRVESIILIAALVFLILGGLVYALVVRNRLPARPVNFNRALNTNQPLNVNEPLNTNEPVNTNEPLNTNESVNTNEPVNTNLPLNPSSGPTPQQGLDYSY